MIFMRILYQFPLSPYCEKVRWILDFKELHYVAQNLRPGLHRAFTQLKTKQNTLPILRDDHAWVGDSTKIALYLDDIYPEHRIIRPQRDLHEKILQWNSFADELGQHIRRWCLASLSAQDEHTLEILLGERGYARQFEKITKPILQKMLHHHFGLNDKDIQQSHQKIQQMIIELNQQLEHIDEFLIGGKLSLADMSLCAMIAPLLQVANTPWEHGEYQIFSDEFYAYQQQLKSMKVANYVQNMYQNHRKAWVDWRGVD